ncbi:Bis(5'-nucleosyl)-tetraphosphatase, symmetrical [Andreprevotia sp. IGB-42]|uniref:symmetrical bis(5'-nucleosyl)-tetraphosphatase n=1 Tax=Andreprevotia sp. IGB-42 TaxID=2497473 RepID=UPI00135ADB7D|nr:symmetrical bis(5'-nucleosyl)-tetraphosphatase [Andreprevotia sp. IGB-42]KAF0811897.1 Bis(5'-nucleosyl)-tetraphosphatase, symmetrical [Andreprevotia sp. IGB-42]
MARYAIGDVQGCFAEFTQLLDCMDFNAELDTVYLVGDLVNRGPDSLGMLHWMLQHRQAARTVLGNHDLHLLAVAAGLAKQKAGDTLDAVLAAPELDTFVDYLRHQPLMITLPDALIAHAGVWPGWAPARAQALADEAAAVLAGPDWRTFLPDMYGNQPSHWDEGLRGTDRLRFVINAMTRMRFVGADGALQLKYKGEIANAPAGLLPWFDWPARQPGPRVVCGHWSALGLHHDATVCALDTGCIWGGALTGIDLDSGQLFQVPAQQVYQSVGE